MSGGAKTGAAAPDQPKWSRATIGGEHAARDRFGDCDPPTGAPLDLGNQDPAQDIRVYSTRFVLTPVFDPHHSTAFDDSIATIT